MSTLLILSVLSAAFLHAFWNFQVKDTPNKAMGMAAVMFGHLPLAGIGLLYSGLPSLEAAPYLVASAFLRFPAFGLSNIFIKRIQIWVFN